MCLGGWLVFAGVLLLGAFVLCLVCLVYLLVVLVLVCVWRLRLCFECGGLLVYGVVLVWSIRGFDRWSYCWFWGGLVMINWGLVFYVLLGLGWVVVLLVVGCG